MKILKKGRTVLKFSFILDVLVTSELVQRHVKQTTKDQGIMIYSILEKQDCVSAFNFFHSTGWHKLGPVSVCIQRKNCNSVR